MYIVLTGKWAWSGSRSKYSIAVADSLLIGRCRSMDKKMGGRLEEREGREFCAVNKKGNSKENQEREWTAGLPSKVYLDNDKNIILASHHR